MVGYNKFEDFVEQLGLARHDLNTNTLKIFLTDELPLAADTVKLDMLEITAGFGYTAGGEDTLNSWAESGGTGTLTGNKVIWTAAGGTIGPFQYVVLYNDDTVTPTDQLIAWWDYASALTLGDGETFTVKFNNGDPTGDVFTLT